MTDFEKLSRKVGKRTGWDFSEVNPRIEASPNKWNFLEVIKDYVDKDTVLLDIGTGGGEFLLKVARSVGRAYGIDNQESMIETAKKNLDEAEIYNVEFGVASSEKLPFKDESFDVVICRHAPFSGEEVARALTTNGLFITQQVRENDKENIKKVFGRGQAYGEETDALLDESVETLKEAGLEIIKRDIYDITEYYSLEDLVFLLKWTPIIPDFDGEKDRKNLEKLEEKYRTGKEIKTNASRFLIIAKKTK